MKAPPFDFSASMRDLCIDITQRHPAFQHIDMADVAVAFAQARRNVSHGLQAKLTPMRFERGAETVIRDGEEWCVQKLIVDGREMLYILTFYLPRFLNGPFQEKLTTIFHELYHISPEFDGDIRRFGGHFYVHSHSQAEYDRRKWRFTPKSTSQPVRQNRSTSSFDMTSRLCRRTSAASLDYRSRSRV